MAPAPGWSLPLRRPSRTQSKVPHLRNHARHLHRVELSDEGQYLRDKVVLREFPDFFLPIGFIPGEQVRNSYLESTRQAC